MNKKAVITSSVLLLALSACSDNTSTTSTATPAPNPAPNPAPAPAPAPTPVTGLERAYPKFTTVFGVQIRATDEVTDEKLLHASKIMAKYLDNNDDGVADNQAVVDELNRRKATIIMPRDEAQGEALQNLLSDVTDGDRLQDLQGSETHPNGAANGVFDGSLEEILHLITHVGYSAIYPEVFGERVDSLIADAMDKARGGRFTTIPAQYPEGAWYTYNDETCDYSCMVTEYTYWALTSILGGQEFNGRLEDIQTEWRLNTREKVRTGDPDAFAILTNQVYMLPTVLPDGNYTSSQFEIQRSSAAAVTPPPGAGQDNEILQSAVAANPNHKVAFTNGSKVMMMSPDGSNLTELADGSPIAGYVSWGPEANYVYFASAKGPTGSAWEAFRVNVKTKALQQLSKFGNDVRNIAVSPDGKHLAISIMSGNSNINNNNDNLTQFHTDLFIIDMTIAENLWANGQMLTRENMATLVSSPAAEQFWYEEINWSPNLSDDGQAVLAYTKTYRYDDDANSYTHAYRIKANGTDMQQIAENKDMPIYSVDGTKLAFLDLSYLDLLDNQFKQLVVSGINDEVSAPAISPDGNFMVTEVGDDNRRLAMARVSTDSTNPGVLIAEINGYEPRWSPKPVEITPAPPTSVISKGADFTDPRDGQVYPTVVIGEQTWMAKNLNFNLQDKSWFYNDDENNAAKYGRLYQWASVKEAIPAGWHLATDAEWQTLERNLGMAEADLTKSGYEVTRGTNQGTQLQPSGASMMNIEAAGFRSGGQYEALENRSYFWVDTTLNGNDGAEIYRRRVAKGDASIYRFTNPAEDFAISVRLVKD